MSHLLVVVPAWVLGDGTVAPPSCGDRVSYHLAFHEHDDVDGPSPTVQRLAARAESYVGPWPRQDRTGVTRPRPTGHDRLLDGQVGCEVNDVVRALTIRPGGPLGRVATPFDSLVTQVTVVNARSTILDPSQNGSPNLNSIRKAYGNGRGRCCRHRTAIVIRRGLRSTI